LACLMRIITTFQTQHYPSFVRGRHERRLADVRKVTKGTGEVEKTEKERDLEDFGGVAEPLRCDLVPANRIIGTGIISGCDDDKLRIILPRDGEHELLEKIIVILVIIATRAIGEREVDVVSKSCPRAASQKMAIGFIKDPWLMLVAMDRDVEHPLVLIEDLLESVT
jgi:hypothetical protein